MSANNDENIAMLLSMGFDRAQAAQALDSCGDLERAIDLLLNGGVVGGGGGVGHRDDVARAPARGEVRAVHSEMSQYNKESLGRSACTAIALTLACNFLKATTGAASNNDPGDVIDPAFLDGGIVEGISMYCSLRGGIGGGQEHSSVEELLGACSGGADFASQKVASTLELLDSSPRQGVLSDAPDHPMGLEAVLLRCREDGAGSGGYVAVVLTKPPETVLVLLPPVPSRPHVLLDSHPRPQQLAPHFPAGSYALFHPSLGSLVDSVGQIFPATELGADVPEMMAMMYNSFDAYPFRRRRR